MVGCAAESQTDRFGWTSEDEGSLGNGVVFGGGVGYMISDRRELVLDVHGQDNTLDKGPGGFFHEGRSLTVGGNFHFHFSQSRARPYLLLGLSYGRFDGAAGFRPGESTPGSRTEGDQSFWGPNLGVGLKAFITRRVAISPEARLFVGRSGDYDPYTDPVEPSLVLTSLAVSVAYHW